MAEVELMEEAVDRSKCGSMDDRDLTWINLLLTTSAERLVKNLRTRWVVARIGSTAMPVTINDEEYENSYVCSPYGACILYPETEVNKIDNALLRSAIRALIRAAGPWLKAAQINRVVCINNWLLSTNLYPQFELGQIAPLTQLLTKRYSSHAIAFRSLNSATNQALIEQLKEVGYLLVPSRQVYCFDGGRGAYLRKQNNIWDQKGLASTSYAVVDHDDLQTADASRIEQLYRWLYVDKYSPQNPQFTAELIDEFRARRLLKLWGLRTAGGRLDGIVGSFARHGVMTVPLVGYDTSLPQKLGLYRFLMAIVLREAAQQRLLLNLSSGASHFKRLRGGTPILEYTAVYFKHLSFVRRSAWRSLGGLLEHVGANILKAYQL